MSESNQDPDGSAPSGGDTGATPPPASAAGVRRPLGTGKPLARKPKKDGAAADAAPASAEAPATEAAAAPSAPAAAAIETTSAPAATAAAPAAAAPAAAGAAGGGVGKILAGMSTGPKVAAAAFAGFVVLGIGYFALSSPGAGGKLAMGSANPNSAASAFGKDIPCKEAKNERVTPLVIDWTSDERTELELAMKDGLAVIEYSCDKVRVIPDCHVAGAYKFTGVQPKEEMRQLANADEFKANLPKSATGKTGAAASLEMDRGATLDIATITVGRKRTVVDSATSADLKGKCTGATHIVRGASVGAFAKGAGQKGKMKTAAEMFGSATSNDSTASAFARSVDGSIDACKKADADGVKPPPQCGAVVSLELIPVLSKADQRKAGEARDSDFGSCPTGMVYSENKCVKKEDAKTFQCEADEFEVCKAQCEKGHPGSCLLYGDMTSNETDPNTDEKNPHYNEAAGFAAFKKACDAGLEGGCSMYTANELDAGKISAAEAVKRLEKSLLSGDNRSRWVYGAMLTGVASKNEKTGKPYGIKTDKPRGMGLLLKSCQGGDPWGCAVYGLAAFIDAQGGAAKITIPADDLAFTIQSNSQMCKPSYALNCIAAAVLLGLQSTTETDNAKKIAALEQSIAQAKVACDAKKHEMACNIVKEYGGALSILKKQKK